MHWICTVCKDTTTIPYQDTFYKEGMIFEQCDSESYSHPMHRLSASETRSGDFNRLKD